MHQNIQSIRNKTLQIEALIDGLANKPALLCFSEHWVLENGGMEFVKISNYRLVSFFARKSLEHGGVCIYCQEDCDLEEDNKIVEFSVEGVVELSCALERRQKILVVCLYRRNLGSFDVFIEQIEKVLNYIYSHYINFKIAIAGDFNLNLYDFNTQCKSFLDLMHSYNLSQTIFDATRVTETSSTLIDNIFCNLAPDFQATGYVLNTALSDHHAQVLCVDAIDTTQCNKGKEHDFILKRIFSENKIKHFKQELQNVDWMSVYECDGVDDAYGAFFVVFESFFKQIFVRKKINVTKKGKSWITAGIKISCMTKRILYYKKNRGRVTKQYFNKYCKILKNVIQQAKNMSNQHYIMNAENKTKATWNLVNNITRPNNKKKTVLQNFSDKYDSAEEILNNINQYLVSACPSMHVDNNKNFIENRVEGSIFMTPVTPNEIVRVVQSLKNKKSVGEDEVPVSVLKAVAEEVSGPLTHIVNLSFITGVFPGMLKVACIKAVHKKGEMDEEKNYRPISLLSNISKIFERVMCDRLISFFERHSVISGRQNGFRKGKSTIRAIYQALERVINSLNDRKLTIMMCMDLSKAFDSVNHDLLCRKLEMYGVRGTSLCLIESYLKDRVQQVVECDENGVLRKSEKIVVNKGVPQGSILGPLLYIIYTNELPDVTDEYVVLYADDTSLIFSEENEEIILHKVHTALDALNEYFSVNDLLLNVLKTQTLIFGNRTEKSTALYYNGGELKSLESMRFLGVEVDKRLDWKAHIECLARSISRYCYALRVVSDNVSVEAAITAYHAYVQSRLRYGVIFWGDSPDIHRILVMQKRCIRSVFRMKQQESCKPLFIKKNILTVIGMYILDSVMYVCDNRDLFIDCDSKHDYDTRYKTNLVPEKYNFTYLQKNVKYSIIKIFNCVPDRIRNLPKNKLKSILKKYLVSKAYYDISDFYNDPEKEMIQC